jgi:hypothetical protein
VSHGQAALLRSTERVVDHGEILLSDRGQNTIKDKNKQQAFAIIAAFNSFRVK